MTEVVGRRRRLGWWINLILWLFVLQEFNSKSIDQPAGKSRGRVNRRTSVILISNRTCMYVQMSMHVRLAVYNNDIPRSTVSIIHKYQITVHEIKQPPTNKLYLSFSSLVFVFVLLLIGPLLAHGPIHVLLMRNVCINLLHINLHFTHVRNILKMTDIALLKSQ